MASPIAFPDDGLSDGVVTLEAVAERHLPEVIAAVSDPRIVRYTVVPSPYGEREAREFLRQTQTGLRSGTQVVTAILDRASGRLRGACGVRQRENDRGHWSIGYWVTPEARGSGFASRAVRLLSRYAFEELGCKRLSLFVEAENSGSVAVARRCGFQLEGTLRSYQEIAGERRDLQSFSLLPGDPLG